jgi:hypothetical protein
MTQETRPHAAFDLIIEGVGYLNRIRLVTPKKGPAYTACTVNAMMGTADAVDYVGIDCRIVGRQALAAVSQLKGAVAAKSKVIVGFRAGDPRPEFYEYKDQLTGESKSASGLKARLLQLTFAKVDGQRVEIPLVQRPAELPTPVPTGPQSSTPVATEDAEAAGSACDDIYRVAGLV